MNMSGEAARFLRDRYGASRKQVLIICDDMDLSTGILRLRARGSAGGHNGLKSVIEAIDSQDFLRIRIGVSRPSDGTDDISYVLSEMPEEHRTRVDRTIERASDVIATILKEGVDQAMNRHN